MTLLCSGNV